jgi:hypothetical protein
MKLRTFILSSIAIVVAGFALTPLGGQPQQAQPMFQPSGAGAVPRTVNSRLAETVSVKDFGAKGDGATDDTAAIQKAINYAIYQSSPKIATVFMPAGSYKITDTLHLGYGDAFRTVALVGDGKRYRGESGFGGTVIDATSFSDRPAVAVQGARASAVRSMTICGSSFNYINDHDLAGTSPDLDDTEISNWFDPGLSANANSRYAPYAGIAIDPYSGTQPGTHYPDVTYPPAAQTGGSAITGQYGKAYSSGVIIEDVEISGFNVGVVIQPCDADGNGDFVKLNRIYIEYCPYGISAGNSQGRNVEINGEFSRIHTCLVNAVHGRQIGKFGGYIRNVSLFDVIQIFDFGAADYAGPINIDNLYAESLWKLGRYGQNSNSNLPIKFTSCEFNFTAQNDARGVPARVLTAGEPNPITFDSCLFAGYPAVAGIGGRVNDLNLIGCSTRPDLSVSQSYEKAALNFLAGGLAFDVTGQVRWPATFSVKLNNRYSLDSSTDTGQLVHQIARSEHAYPISAWSRWAEPTNATGNIVPVPLLWAAIGKTTGISSASLSGRTLTITFSNRSEANFAKYGPLPGDVIYDSETGSIFFVQWRSLQQVQSLLMNNYKAGEALAPISTSSGTWYVGNSRVFRTSDYLRGTTSSSSAIISSAGSDNDAASFIQSEIQVFDWLFVDDLTDLIFPLTNAKVMARSNSGSITLGGNATKTATSRAFPFWIRRVPNYWGSTNITKYLSIPGNSGDYCTLPDSAALSITGDIDVRAKVAPGAWSGGIDRTIWAHRGSTASDTGYVFRIRSDGKLELYWGNGSSFVSGPTSTISTVTTGFADGTTHWIRATRVQSTGVVQFFTSSDGSSWSQMGADRTAGGTNAVNNSASSLCIGSLLDGSERFGGAMYYLEVLSGVDGTVQFQADFTAQTEGDPSFVEASTNAATVSMNGNAIIVAEPQ